jgi:transcriptional regulator with XRE-family HTH domain
VTQVQLAARLGISQPQLSRIERGERNVTIPAMAAIARALGYRLTVTLDPPPDLESNNAA